MTETLDTAFDRARAALPDAWRFIGFTEDAAGWVVSAGKKSPMRDAPQDWEWWPRKDARGRTLTKALLTLAEELEYEQA